MNECRRLAMKLPKRFALSTLLLLMLVVAVVFGYAQWRRLSLTAEVAELNELGEIVLAMPNSSTKTRTFSTLLTKGEFWPTIYTDSVLVFGKDNGGGEYEFGGEVYSAANARLYLSRLEQRLRALGVQKFAVKVFVPRANGYTVKSFASVDSLE